MAVDFGGEGLEAGAELVDFDREAGEGERFTAAEAVLFDERAELGAAVQGRSSHAGVGGASCGLRRRQWEVPRRNRGCAVGVAGGESRRVENRSIAITVAVIGAAGTIAAALIAKSGGDGDGSAQQQPSRVNTPVIQVPTDVVSPKRAEIFLSRDSGPGGSTVLVSGKGFQAGERVVLSFHTEQVGSTTAGQTGGFERVEVTIPTSFSKFAPQQFFINANGETSIQSASAPFTISG